MKHFFRFSFLLLVALFAIPVSTTFAQTQPTPQSQTLTPWKVIQQKIIGDYRVEISERRTTGKFPRVDSMKARIVPSEGGSVTEYTGTWLTADPKDFVEGWKEGQNLDMTGNGVPDIVLRNSTGGIHCCYNYVIFSTTNPLKKLGDIPMKDCGEKIRLQDLNGDGKSEIISCDSKFTYLGDLPYSKSPFPPAIYTLGANGYERADLKFKQVYEQDIAKQRELLKQGYQDTAVLQIVTDYFTLGEDNQGWEAFEKLYQGKDKEKIKLQLLQKRGLKLPTTPAPAPKTPEKPAPPTTPLP